MFGCTYEIFFNYSVGLRIHCADRKKMYHAKQKSMAKGHSAWIFACNYEGTEQLQYFYNKKGCPTAGPGCRITSLSIFKLL
ncbi:hypothetical protein K040078D81_33080 [Blautia hominis]|uniref:Uncharacterized protein n=1 Tax=Blautia hominis TaxID=2025493 RepID=A0ABQ0BCM0_9FIRM